jgi:hypothetical protein
MGRHEMKSALISSLLLACSPLLLHAGVLVAAQIDSAIDAAVVRLKATDPKGVEYPRYRHLAVLDLDADGRGYLIAAFSIESGESNAVYRYVGVWKLIASDALEERAVVELDTVRQGIPTGTPTLSAEKRIVFPSVRYAPGDSRCCPSIQGAMTFSFVDGQLVGVPAP